MPVTKIDPSTIVRIVSCAKQRAEILSFSVRASTNAFELALAAKQFSDMSFSPSRARVSRTFADSTCVDAARRVGLRAEGIVNAAGEDILRWTVQTGGTSWKESAAIIEDSAIGQGREVGKGCCLRVKDVLLELLRLVCLGSWREI